jgi:hypothetical protein
VATNKSLDLDDSPRTRVFRQLVQIFQADLTLSRVIAPRHWRTFSGEPADKTEFGATACPSVVMSRIPGDERFWSPDSFTGEMHVQLLLQTRGTCEDDCDNLYWHFQRAIYPLDNDAKITINRTLVAAGAHTGLVLFSQPAFDPRNLNGQASEGLIVARGTMRIEIRHRF